MSTQFQHSQLQMATRTTIITQCKKDSSQFSLWTFDAKIYVEFHCKLLWMVFSAHIFKKRKITNSFGHSQIFAGCCEIINNFHPFCSRFRIMPKHIDLYTMNLACQSLIIRYAHYAIRYSCVYQSGMQEKSQFKRHVSRNSRDGMNERHSLERCTQEQAPMFRIVMRFTIHFKACS